MSNIASVLKERRKALGLTLAQIAEMTGVTEATVQRWESGNIKTLRHERITRLAEILGVSPSTLMGWEDDAPPAGDSVNRIGDDDIKFALWGKRDIDDKLLDKVKTFAKFAFDEQEEHHGGG